MGRTRNVQWREQRGTYGVTGADLAGWQGRKRLAAALRAVYTAASAKAGLRGARDVRAGLEGPALSDDGEDVAPGVRPGHPVPRLPPEVRRVIDTTNAVEAVHAPRPQDHQDPRSVSDGRSGGQIDLADPATSGISLRTSSARHSVLHAPVTRTSSALHPYFKRFSPRTSRRQQCSRRAACSERDRTPRVESSV